MSGPIDLLSLASPTVVMEPARLYAALRDDAGTTGPPRFLADLPAGSAVFALTAPGASFLLTARASATAPQLGSEPPDAAAIDAWCAALLSCPGVPRGDGEALPIEAGDHRHLAAGSRITARDVVWLTSETPVLRYPEAAEAALTAASD